MAKIKTDEEFFAAVDSVAQMAAQIEILKARQAEAQIALNREWGAKIDAIEKPHKALFNSAKKYAVANREALLGSELSGKTKAAAWGFRENPAKVIPKIKIKDAALVEELKALPLNRGMEYLNVSYTLDKSKIAEAIGKGVKWVCSIFQLTKDEQFYVDKIKAGKEPEARMEGIL